MKECIEYVANCLNYFIGDYFKIELADNSDFEIAEILIRLHNELKDKNEKLLNSLIARQDKTSVKYVVDFPITGKQVPPPKKKDESDEDDDEEGEEEEDEKEEKDKNKDDDKMKIDEIDEDGFILVKKKGKGKKKGF